MSTYAQRKREQTRQKWIHRKYAWQKQREEQGAEKKYPLDIIKCAYELHLAQTLLTVEYINREDVSPKMKAWATDRKKRLDDIERKKDRYNVSWLNGQEYGFAKKAMQWAVTLLKQRKEEVAKELQGWADAETRKAWVGWDD